jgi:phage baseplate assembly protein W
MRSFKSVGITGAQLTAQQNAITQTPIKIGIVTPLAIGSNDEGLLAMSYNVGAQMKNNLRDLVMTNWGERLGFYDYGANLQPLVTEYENGKDQFDEVVMQRIMATVQKYMPYVELQGFDSRPRFAENIGIGTVQITIDYSIPRANVNLARLEISFAVT